MAYFEFINSVKICSGAHALENIVYELDFLGSKKPLILSDNGVKNAGVLDKVTTILSKNGIPTDNIFTDIPADSDVSVINSIAGAFRQSGCDGIIACGGGSVIDTAKGVRLVLSQQGKDILGLMGNEIIKKGAHIPFIVLPTTCGTGSECTAVAVIKNHETGIKMEYISSELLPDTAIIDVRLTETLPKKLIASSAMDALVHSIEAFSSKQKNPISDAYATTAMRLITTNLPVVLESPTTEARENLALASTLAGIAFSNAMVGVVHAIGHALGGECGVPHGNAMAVLLPKCMKFNLDTNRAEYGEMLLYLAGAEKFASTPKDKRAEASIEFVINFERKIHELSGIALTLHEYGVTEDKFQNVAKKALNDGAVIANRKDVTEADVLDILKKCL